MTIIKNASRSLVVMAAAMTVLGGCSAADSGTNDASSASGKGDKGSNSGQQQEASAAVNVDAAKLLKAFESNEAAADLKYDGETLQVTGEVVKVDTEFFDEDDYVTQLGSGAAFEIWTVNCNDMAADDVSKLGKGDMVTVTGEFDDGGDLGIEIKDCSVA